MSEYSNSPTQSQAYSISPSGSPLRGGTPLLGFSIDLDVPDGSLSPMSTPFFMDEGNIGDDESGWSSAEEVPQPLPCVVPTCQTSRPASIYRSFERTTLHVGSPAVLRLLLYFSIGFAALLSLLHPYLGTLHKLPTDSIAFVAFRHASLGMELVNELDRLSECCTKGEFYSADALRLWNVLETHDPQASSESLILSERLRRIESDSIIPENYIVVDGMDQVRKLGVASRLLKMIAPEGPRNVVAEQVLEDIINEYFAKDVPRTLGRLNLQLQKALTDVELAQAKREQLLTSINQNRETLGLVKPETWMWWRIREWENNPVIQDQVRSIQGVVRSFEILGKYRDFLDKCLKAVEAYMSSIGIFETLDQYPKSSEDVENRTHHYLDKIETLLKELEERVSKYQPDSKLQ
ncbi:hypothetical protein FRC02_012359 [Tulasnella sp. 418]|nr:hypothetical protein FRC02_012359 [Tulasnella sp. 418]